jgi:DNA-binding MarR family transcriptional regulator
VTDRPLRITDLISYRLGRVANLASRGAALRYRRQFGVSLMEWRIVALLGGFAPMSLNDVAKEAGLDKGQTSRAVSALRERGIVARAVAPGDARLVSLSLTAAGEALYRGLMAAAEERNDAFANALTKEERACLDRALAKVAQAAQALIRAERQVEEIREEV